MLSAIVKASDDGDTLSANEAISMAFLLLVAGHETTVNLIGNGMLALLRRPDQHAALRADPSLIPNAAPPLPGRAAGPAGGRDRVPHAA